MECQFRCWEILGCKVGQRPLLDFLKELLERIAKKHHQAQCLRNVAGSPCCDQSILVPASGPPQGLGAQPVCVLERNNDPDPRVWN